MALVIALCVDSTWSLSNKSFHTLPYILQEVLFPLLGYEFLGGSESAFFIRVSHWTNTKWLLNAQIFCLLFY